ncbi:porin [Massilia niastensis]|uniref:porin n=1 Tax=Massilia niastensis TaxID=544911 RepID=UPI0003626069|nr:porin [Massilia niastensis]
MKKAVIGTTLALVGGIAAQPVLAQGQVSIYGIVDSGVVHTNHADAAGESVTKVPGLTGSVPSRIGFRGAEDLGGGLQALFTLEGGINVDTGTMGQGNRLFGRQAWVGLKNRYGTLMVGRLPNMTFYSMLKSDVLGPNLFSISSIDLYIPNARSDNAVGYMGTFANITAGATYSVGRDISTAGGPAGTACAGEVPGNSKACRQVTALLGYDNQAFGVTAAYDKMQGNTGAAMGLATPDSYDRRVTVSGYAMLGKTRIGAGVMSRKKLAATRAADLESDLYFVGAKFQLAPAMELDAQVARHAVEDSPNDSTLAVMRLTYLLSKRTAVYGSLGHMKNRGAAAIALDAGGTVGIGMNQSGVNVGVRHSF